VTAVDSTALAARLAEIADDPGWPHLYRLEAGEGPDGRGGQHPLNPASLSDDHLRLALHARIAARGAQPSTVRPDDPDRMRERLAELDAARVSPS
jgi:hypothetical protein